MKRAFLIHGLVLFFIAFIALLPVFGVVVVSEIAEANNCDLDEGSIHPCVVNGRDIGGTLYTFGVLGWLMLATIPLGLAAMAIYIAAVAAFYLIRMLIRRRRAAAVQNFE